MSDGPIPQGQGSLPGVADAAAANRQVTTGPALNPKRRPPSLDERETFSPPHKRGGGRSESNPPLVTHQDRRQQHQHQHHHHHHHHPPGTDGAFGGRERREERRPAVTHFPAKQRRPRGHERQQQQIHHHPRRQQQQRDRQLGAPTPTPCVVCQGADAKYRCPKCLARYCSVGCCKSHRDGSPLSAGSCRQNPPSAPPEDAAGTQVADGGGADTRISSSRYRRELGRAVVLLGPHSQAASFDGSQNPRDGAGIEELDEGWKITGGMVAAMRESDWLRTELRDGSLRRLIRIVAGTSDTVVTERKVHRSRGDVTTTEQEVALERLKSELPEFRRFLDKLLVVAGVLERQPRPGACGAAPVELNEWLRRDVPTQSEPLILKPLPRTARSVPPDSNSDNPAVSNTDRDRESSGGSTDESFSRSDSTSCREEDFVVDD